MSDLEISGADPVGETLSLLTPVLRRFVHTEMTERHGADWEAVARAALPTAPPDEELDLASLLQTIEKHWATVFVAKLTQADRGYVSELRGVRNQWVHQRPFTAPDLRRTFDVSARLLQAMGAPDDARVVTAQRAQLIAATIAPTVSVRAPRASRATSARVATVRDGATVSTPKRTVLVKKVAKPQLRPSSGSFPKAAAGIAPELAPLATAFIAVFGQTYKTAGASALGTHAISDAAEGVQWSAAFDRATGKASLSVNLEGVEYDDWPVARLIARELEEASFPTVARTVSAPATVTLHWLRDCWQGDGRLRIREQDLAPTPLTLDRFTPGIWRDALTEARTCLDAAQDHRGRVLQTVTMTASGDSVTKSVSPHLQVSVTLQRAHPDDSWEPALRAAKAILDPLYDWAVEASR